MYRFTYSVTLLFSVVFFFGSCAGSKPVVEVLPVKKPAPVLKPVEVIPVPATPVSATAVNTRPEIFTGFANVFPATLKNVLDKKADNRVQIIYLQIDRDKNNIPHFTPHYFNVEPGAYFPGGTTLSLPLALFSLQKTNELKMEGVNAYTTMITEAAGKNLPGTYNDPTTENGKPTISNYLQRLLLVNDTAAFNRLYELLGQEYLIKNMQANGFSGTEIVSRLWENLTLAENAITNPVTFYNETGRAYYKQPLASNSNKLPMLKNTAGEYFANANNGTKKIDLAGVNKISLPELTALMQNLFFPEAGSNRSFFNLLPADRTFLQAWLGLLPRQNKFPAYANDFADAFDKYLYYGADNGRKDARMRIYNVSGKDYGQMTDVAYVADLDRKVEFIVAATIYCGVKTTAGKIQYNYSSTGLPFFRDLGLAIYRYELLRKKTYLPDFTSLPLSE